MWTGVAECVLIGVVYVLGLYVVTSKGVDVKDRNHPEVIKNRLISVGVTTTVTVAYVILAGQEIEQSLSCIGVRMEGFTAASTLPLLLTMTLFCGPIVAILLDYDALTVPYLTEGMGTLPSLRDHFVGPVTEEIVFRACMLCLLGKSGLHGGSAVAVTAVVFGFAHAHHVMNTLHNRGIRTTTSQAILTVAVQVSFTTVFGSYAAAIFLSSRHLIACILPHIFCNIIGFPDFSLAIRDKYGHKRSTSTAMVGLISLFGGIVGFWWLIAKGDILNPGLYQA